MLESALREFCRMDQIASIVSHIPVADPGFSQGGAPTPKITIIFQNFAENCMKMKEFGPPGGGRPWRPPLDPPMHTMVSVNRLKSNSALIGQDLIP